MIKGFPEVQDVRGMACHCTHLEITETVYEVGLHPFWWYYICSENGFKKVHLVLGFCQILLGSHGFLVECGGWGAGFRAISQGSTRIKRLSLGSVMCDEPGKVGIKLRPLNGSPGPLVRAGQKDRLASQVSISDGSTVWALGERGRGEVDFSFLSTSWL